KRPRDRRVLEPRGPGLRPAGAARIGVGGADAVYQPGPADPAAAGRRRPVFRAGGGGAAKPHPLPPVAERAAAAAAAPRSALATHLAPVAEPSVDCRSRRRAA